MLNKATFFYFNFFIIFILPITNSYIANLQLYVKDFIDSIYLDDNLLYIRDDFNNKNYIEKIFNINYGNNIIIKISSKGGEYGISAILKFFNGEKEEIISLNDYWKKNDNHYSINYPFNSNFNLSKFSIMNYTNNINDYLSIKNQNYYSYIYNLSLSEIVNCENSDIFFVDVGEVYEIDLSKLISTKIKSNNELIINIESDFKGIIQGENNINISKGIDYKDQKFIYATKYYNHLDIIYYSLKYHSLKSSKCKFGFYTCPQKCSKCILNNKNKIKCIEESKKLLNLMKKINNPNKKYYNLTNRKLSECFSSCLTCDILGDENEHNCNSCKEGYYPIIHNNEKNCYKNPIGYYLKEEENKYYPCGNNCSMCEINSNNIKCTSCLDSYYYLEEKNACYQSFKGYYLDSSNNFKKCYETCEECNGEGNLNNPNCKEKNCVSNAYYFEDNLTKCYYRTDIPEGYTFYNNIIIKCHENCKSCSGKYTSRAMKCIECKDNYYPVAGRNNECYNTLIGYYLTTDVNNKKYFAPCHSECETCNEGYNFAYHSPSCLTCKFGKMVYINNKQRSCTSDCHDILLKNDDKDICISSCSDIEDLFEINNTCITKTNCESNNGVIEGNKCVDCPPDSIVKNGKCVKRIIYYDYLNSTFDDTYGIIHTILFNLRTNTLINGFDFSMEVINTNEEYTYKSNLSVIDLDECEKILRKQYNINNDDNLLITKFDIKNTQSNSLTGGVRYKVFDSKGNELDLNYCKSNVIIQYPIDINNAKVNFSYAEYMNNLNIDIFNPKDEYFNDLCKKTIGNNSDITISKRRDDIYVNSTICENNCEYININYTTMKVNCNCSIFYEYEKVENTFKNLIENTFSDSIPKTNILICKCYKHFISFKKNLTNIGFWFYIFLVIVDIILFVHYIFNGLDKDKKILFSLLLQKEKRESLASPPKKNQYITNSSEIYLDDRNDSIRFNKKIFHKDIKTKLSNLNSPVENKSILLKKSNLDKQHSNILSTQRTNPSVKNLIENDTTIYSKHKSINLTILNKEENKNKTKEKKKNKNKKTKNVKFDEKKDKIFKINRKYIDRTITNFTEDNLFSYIGRNGNILKRKSLQYETTTEIFNHILKYEDVIFVDDDDINNAHFIKAINDDDRSFIKMLWDFFLKSQGLFNAFMQNSKYEIITIKISIYLAGLGADFWLNAVFYSDDVVDEKYNKGKISFVTELLKSLYSCLVGILISVFLNYFINYYNYFDILEKEYNIKSDVNFSIFDKFLRKVKKELCIFFLLNFFLMLWFLYYCTIFCNIYHHNQIDWFKGGWISFIMIFFTSCIISLIISLLRYYALKKNNIHLYYLSCYIGKFT